MYVGPANQEMEEGMSRKTGKLTNEPKGFVKMEEGSVTVMVTAVESRVSYGRREYLVTPVAGEGSRWCYATGVTWVDEPEFDGPVASK